MKYLKYLQTTNDFESFKNSEDYILPNVSYVVETKGVSYAPKKVFKLRAKYNATSDNLLAFNGATNIAALKVNGNSIKFEPIKNEIISFDVLGENISLDMETGAASFPESYLIKSPVSSWSFKAKDPNYVINENTFACIFGMQDGMLFADPIPLEEAMNSELLTTNDGITLEAVGTFLAEMNIMMQYGMQICFTLCDMDMNSGTFMFIDTEHQTNVITGGLSTYSFDSEGLYDVEIELADPDMKMYLGETTLISIEIGDGITTICKNAFYGCSGLTSVVIPNSVTTIGEQAFNECSGLTEITIPNSITSIEYYVFGGCSALTNITIPNSVTSIGDYAFFHCTSLTNIIIPDSVTSIGKAAFNGCSELTSVNIPDSVTTIDTHTFWNCSALTEITIPNSVTSIGKHAFDGCSRLTDVTIGSGVTSIGDWAFLECTSLTSITCLALTAPTITSGTFQKIKLSGILKVPSGSDYSSWMSTNYGYLGYYNWTVQYI